MTKNNYHHGNLKAEVLECALKRAAKYGPTGIGIREIARELNVSAPAIYRHYDNLSTLITAVKNVVFEQITDYVQAEIATQPHYIH
jgi:AcrR family transcriptional regulator